MGAKLGLQKEQKTGDKGYSYKSDPKGTTPAPGKAAQTEPKTDQRSGGTSGTTLTNDSAIPQTKPQTKDDSIEKSISSKPVHITDYSHFNNKLNIDDFDLLKVRPSTFYSIFCL